MVHVGRSSARLARDECWPGAAHEREHPAPRIPRGANREAGADRIGAIQSLPDPQPAVIRSSATMKRSRGRRQHASTRSACSGVNASGNAVSALALSVRVRTLRNWPDSPASKPGGVNRSQRGSDNRSATACSITRSWRRTVGTHTPRSGSRLPLSPNATARPGAGWLRRNA